jgi:hypothetical protein
VVGVARDIALLRFGGSGTPPAYRLRRVDALRNVVLVGFDAGEAAAPAAVREPLLARRGAQSDPLDALRCE